MRLSDASSLTPSILPCLRDLTVGFSSVVTLTKHSFDQELTPLMDSLDLTNVVDCYTTKNSMPDVFLVPASMALGYRPVTCSAPLGNSDHFVCRLSPNDEEPMEFASHPIYDLCASRVSGFVNTLSTVNFHQLYHASNIDTKVNLLYEAINLAMKEIPRQPRFRL